MANVDKKVFDVVKPGKSSPDATSRPMIVSNRPIVKDPTLKHEDKSLIPVKERADDSSQTNLKSAEVKTITPPTLTKDIYDKESSQAPDSTKSEQKYEPYEDQTIDEIPQDIEQSTIDKKIQNELSDKEKEHQATVEKLVIEGVYTAPIGQIKRKRNNIRLLLILIIVMTVGLFVGNLLIDGGFIKTNIKPVVHILN